MISNTSRQERYIQKYKQHEYFIKITRVFILIIFLCVWEFTANYNIIDSFIFSSPSKIFICFIEMIQNQTLFLHISVTLYETIISFICVISLSFICTIILWFFSTLANILDPYLVVLNSLPKSALAPLLIVWLGANTATIIVAGMSVALFGSILNLYANFQATDPQKIKLIYTLNGTKLQALTKVVIPSSIPALINIMKVNIGLCLVGVIIGEFLAAKRGLGYLIIYSSQVFKMDWLLMSIVLLCIMAMLLYSSISFIEKYYLRKHQEKA